MQVSVQIHSADFERALVSAAAALGRDLPAVYREEAGRVMQNLMGIRTPPRSYSQGIKRLYGDLLNVVTPANERWLDALQSRFGLGPASGKWRVKGGAVITFAYARIIRSLDELAAWHRSRRHAVTGRTRYQRTRDFDTPDKAFVSKTLFARYYAQLKRRLGAAKGGWWAAARHVATRRPPGAWVTGKTRFGSAIVDLRPGPRQTFIAINSSPWTRRPGEAERAARDALRFRARIIPRAVARQLRLRYSAAGFLVKGLNVIDV